MNTTALTLLQKYVDSHVALNVLLSFFFFSNLGKQLTDLTLSLYCERLIVSI